MAESGELSCCTESDSDSFLLGSMNYSTDNSDDDGVFSDTLVLAEFEVALAPYRFKPEVSDSESIGLSGKVYPG